MDVKTWLVESRAFLSMLMVQVIGTGLQLLSRVILSQGTFIFALMAYRHIVGAVCVAPFAFFWERDKGKELNMRVGLWLFMNALTGISLAMGLFYYGLRDTTATYATNFLNLIPIVTFLFSTITGVEKLHLGTKYGKIKTLGAILCLAGALTISLYKGKAFYIGQSNTDTAQPHHHVIKAHHNWTRGTMFLVCSILSYATWFLVQVKLFTIFPHKYWATMMTCIMASMQATAIGLCLDRSKASWSLGWNLQLITIIYSGALASAATFCLISWTIRHRGPTYPSMFNPLALLFVAITEALFLGEAITVGSLVGMSLIIVGIYSFLWGKSKEPKIITPPPKAAADEASDTVAAESSATAIVVPASSSSSRSSSTTHGEDLPDHHGSQREVLGL